MGTRYPKIFGRLAVSSLAAWGGVAALTACDPVAQEDVAGGCPAGSAQILVLDGGLQRLCGCTETDTALVAPPTTLTCTVSAGAVVFFQYLNTQSMHQIVSTGTPSFASSAVHDPQAESPVRVHAVKLETAGTYAFEDALNSAVTGQIVVTP